MINKNDILDVLHQVNDPELGVNIVDLGLVYTVAIENNSINITMTLTWFHITYIKNNRQCSLH